MNFIQNKGKCRGNCCKWDNIWMHKDGTRAPVAMVRLNTYYSDYGTFGSTIHFTVGLSTHGKLTILMHFPWNCLNLVAAFLLLAIIWSYDHCWILKLLNRNWNCVILELNCVSSTCRLFFILNILPCQKPTGPPGQLLGVWTGPAWIQVAPGHRASG